ncbi:hypothetical protein HC823_00695 [Candidatus Gracilibacteria bacterium]|nr:hypothetical protein [Candidatus Gracilibacteria bacterium]
MRKDIEEYNEMDIPGLNEVQMRRLKFGDDKSFEKARKEQEKPLLSLAMVKVKWNAYYYSRGRYKLGAAKAFEGFLEKHRRWLNSLRIYSFEDYKRLVA